MVKTFNARIGIHDARNPYELEEIVNRLSEIIGNAVVRTMIEEKKEPSIQSVVMTPDPERGRLEGVWTINVNVNYDKNLQMGETNKPGISFSKCLMS